MHATDRRRRRPLALSSVQRRWLVGLIVVFGLLGHDALMAGDAHADAPLGNQPPRSIEAVHHDDRSPLSDTGQTDPVLPDHAAGCATTRSMMMSRDDDGLHQHKSGTLESIAAVPSLAVHTLESVNENAAIPRAARRRALLQVFLI